MRKQSQEILKYVGLFVVLVCAVAGSYRCRGELTVLLGRQSGIEFSRSGFKTAIYKLAPCHQL
jgi:hypothetical protein